MTNMQEKIKYPEMTNEAIEQTSQTKEKIFLPFQELSKQQMLDRELLDLVSQINWKIRDYQLPKMIQSIQVTIKVNNSDEYFYSNVFENCKLGEN